MHTSVRHGLAALGIALSFGALAQAERPPAVIPVPSEPAAKLVVYPPVPEALARGVIIVQFRTENLRIMPVFGAKGAEVSPHLGHMHVTVDDRPGTWAHTSYDPVIIVGLPPGPHKILMELADPNHKILTAETVHVTVPDVKAGMPHAMPTPTIDTGEIQVSPDITLRHMVYRPAHPKGTLLFLHGFPETMYAWKPIAESLASEYEVHAFDWPGYGQSSRPSAERFAYAPIDYAHVLENYIRAAGIDRSKLVIYASDIGALPALLAALEQPDIASKIIVGDFAPFNRPQYMYASLQGLKSKPAADAVHAAMNKGRDEILANAFFRGLPAEQRYPIPQDFKDDMAKGWGGEITSADAFYHYYANFTRDQDYFEAHMSKLKVPVEVMWGEQDFYINKDMGREFAQRSKVKLTILPNLGHYPHLQAPEQTTAELRAALAGPL